MYMYVYVSVCHIAYMQYIHIHTHINPALNPALKLALNRDQALKPLREVYICVCICMYGMYVACMMYVCACIISMCMYHT